MAKPDSLQGSLDLLVLKILSRRPRLHGYAIMSAIKESLFIEGFPPKLPSLVEHTQGADQTRPPDCFRRDQERLRLDLKTLLG
jgi:hypothetical protein